jgi:pimeloyl-ACP methyl ester carboxylesterase
LGVHERPVTKYAKAPDGVSVAYQVSGGGALDVLFRPGMGIPIDLFWDEPRFVRFAKRLGGFSRVVMADLRGVGASGGDVRDSVVGAIGDSDVTSVLDAVGCQRVVLFGTGLGGPATIRYATHHPERVQALVLVDTFAYLVREDDYPWGLPPESLERRADALAEMWGTGATADVIAPSKSSDEAFRAWWARAERLSSAANQIAAILRALVLQDVRALLPTLTVPTLVLHRVGNLSVPIGVDLVGSDMAFSERGTHVLKGVPDLWRLYAIEC